MSDETSASNETTTKAVDEQLSDLSINASPATLDPQPVSNTFNVQNALDYLNKVKLRFEDRPEVYKEFLGVMGDFHHQRIDTAGAIQQTGKLFKDHPDLMKEFSSFVPDGLSAGIPTQPQRADGDESTMPAGKPDPSNDTMKAISERLEDLSIHAPPVSSSPQLVSSTLSMQDALDYLDKVKSHFTADRPEVYETFLSIMGDFRNQRLDASGVTKRVASLFDGNPDLLAEFGKFLPAGLATGILVQPQRSDDDKEGENSGESAHSDATSPGNGQ